MDPTTMSWEELLPHDVWTYMLSTFVGSTKLLMLALLIASKGSTWHQLVIRCIRYFNNFRKSGAQLQLPRLEHVDCGVQHFYPAIVNIARLIPTGLEQLRRLAIEVPPLGFMPSLPPVLVGLQRLNIHFGNQESNGTLLWVVLSACPNLVEAKFPDTNWSNLDDTRMFWEVPAIPKKFVFLSLATTLWDFTLSTAPNFVRTHFDDLRGEVHVINQQDTPAPAPTPTPAIPLEGDSVYPWFWRSSAYWTDIWRSEDAPLPPWQIHPFWHALSARSQFKIIKLGYFGHPREDVLSGMAKHCRIAEWSQKQWYQIVTQWPKELSAEDRCRDTFVRILEALYETSPQRLEETIYRMVFDNDIDPMESDLRIFILTEYRGPASKIAESVFFNISRYDPYSTSVFARQLWKHVFHTQLYERYASARVDAYRRGLSNFFANGSMHIMEFLMALECPCTRGAARNYIPIAPVAPTALPPTFYWKAWMDAAPSRGCISWGKVETIDRILEIWPDVKHHTFRHRCLTSMTKPCKPATNFSFLQRVALEMKDAGHSESVINTSLSHLITRHGCRDYIVQDTGHRLVMSDEMLG